MAKHSRSSVAGTKRRAPQRSKVSSLLTDLRKGIAHLEYGSAVSPGIPKHAIERPSDTTGTTRRMPARTPKAASGRKTKSVATKRNQTKAR